MGNLWIFYDRTCQRISLEHFSLDKITIGSRSHHMISIHSFPFSKGFLSFKGGRDSHLEVFQGRQSLGVLTVFNPIEVTEGTRKMFIFLTGALVYRSVHYIEGYKELFFARNDVEADVSRTRLNRSLPLLKTDEFYLTKSNGSWTVIPNRNGLFLNGQNIAEKTSVQPGDILTWPFMEIRLLEADVIQMRSSEAFKTKLPLIRLPESEMKKNYPQYRRTPRMVYELPNEKVQFSFPSHEEEEDDRRGLWLTLLPPLVMLIVTGAVVLIQPRGIFMLVSLSMFLVTLVTSSVTYLKDTKKRKKQKRKKCRIYTSYLEGKRQELQKLSEEQRQIMFYHFPSFERMKYLTTHVSDRIWERSMESADFLQLRLGTGVASASYTISLGNTDMANREMDELLEQTQLMERVYKKVDGAPITANLSKGTMGLIGKKSVVKNEIHQLIGQLAFFHSYHDLRFVLIFHEQEYPYWEWMKWLPHCQLPHVLAKGLIYNEKTRDQLLSSIYELLRERDLGGNKGGPPFSPHFIFVIANRQLISNHIILEYLEGNHVHLGMSILFAAGTKESLTEHIHTLVRYVNEDEGDILIQDQKAVRIPFQLDSHHRKGNESFARMLRTLNHQIRMENSIPTNVSFLELLKVKKVSELPIEKNWLSNESSKSLAVPIGLKGKRDIVKLNLHEKAHGPHGLLAGTTGSGKSEFLQTFILSLAVHFHPHEVAFLLIDYKGGGMAQPFKKIPHLLGTITNIDESKNFSTRALASIKSELKRRQRLFDQYGVNHINGYTDLYKQKKAHEPLPHLFLISDEFAELKNEEPRFIKEVISAARIGRSLGVHLILATQKPGGVINDQIWSNSRFKIALKVQSTADSKEILKNTDAATITATGRGYLQVGNNEVYELFQSGWSGAPYIEDAYKGEDEVAIITDLERILLTDVSVNDYKKEHRQTEMEAIVDKIEATQQSLGIQRANSPWLPPLAKRLSRIDDQPENEESFYIGLTDEPEKQSQPPYGYQMIEDGNIGVFGSSGYGKSFTVMTLLLGLAEKFSPERLHFYIFDFGNGSLFPLCQLSHTGEYFSVDEEKKIAKFIRLMKKEMYRRKQLFQQKEVSHINMYNELSDVPLPLIFITLDHFDLAKEELDGIEESFIQFARDGQSFGIFMIFTVTRVKALRQSLMNNLKTKVIHYLMDTSEAQAITGKLPYLPEAIPGRAMIHKDQSCLVQLFLPADGEDDLAVLNHVKDKVQEINKKYGKVKGPAPVPMLPPQLTMDDLENHRVIEQKTGLIPLGLDEESVTPVFLDLVKSYHLLVFGQTQKGKTNILKIIMNTSLVHQIEGTGLFDSVDHGLSDFANDESVCYLTSKKQIVQWMDDTQRHLQEREDAYKEAIHNGTVHQLFFTPVFLVIDGFARFRQSVDNKVQERLSQFMKNYHHLGFKMIVAGNHYEFTKGYDPLTTEVRFIQQAVILMKKSEQNLFTLPFDRKETEIHAGFGHFIVNGKVTKIQIPYCTASLSNQTNINRQSKLVLLS